ncbi:MAG: hypothetical protein HYY40_10760 [Bacteroidetes bacterium]|nr:hypothetical protein [Bacteroidota bacterium]
MKRKVYISYVIQGDNHHSHYSEIIEVNAPYYSFAFASDSTTANEIMKWKEQKEKTISLSNRERLVVTNYFIV